MHSHHLDVVPGTLSRIRCWIGVQRVNLGWNGVVRGVTALFVLAMVTGCASIKVSRIADSKKKTYEEGVRFYRPWPYLSLTREKKDSVESLKGQVLMLPNPDPSEEYVITWSTGLFGTVNPNFTLADGWNLTGFNSKVESGTTGFISSVADLAAGIKDIRGASGNPLKPGLYLLVPTERLVGGKSYSVWVPSEPAVFAYE